MTRREPWERPLDICKLIVSIILLAVLILLALRCAPQVTVAAPPVFTRPTSGATFEAEELNILKGTADPGATLRFFDGDKLLGETTVQPEDKEFRLLLSAALAEGPHSVRASVIDETGEEMVASASVAFTIVPPIPAAIAPGITTPASGASFGASEPLTFEGTAAPGAKVRLYDGETLLGEVAADADGKWRFKLPEALAAGAHALRSVVLDIAGQEAAASEVVTLTMEEPIVAPALVSPASGASFGAGELLTFEGTAAPGTKVRLYDGETLLGEVTADADGEWGFDLTEALAAGAHTLRAVVLDAAGEEIAASKVVTLTMDEPIVAPAVVSPASGASFGTGESLAFGGTAAPGAKVRLYDGDTLLGEVAADADGEWHFELPEALAAGAHALRAVVLDAAGEEVAASELVALTVEEPIIAPVVVSPAGGASIGAGESLAFEGTAAPGAKVRLYDGEMLLGELTADADGEWRFELPQPLTEGLHELRTVVLDAAGEEAAASELLTFSIIKAATPPIILLPDERNVVAGGMVEGTADPDALLQIYDGDTLLGEVAADADGKWTFELPADLSTGEHTLRAVAVDDAGEALAESEPASFDMLELRLPVTGSGM